MLSMPIKTIFFDMGDVVISNSSSSSFRRNLSEFLGLEYEKVKPKIDKVIDPFVKGKITEKEFWTKLFQTFKIPPKTGYKEFLMKEFSDNWLLNEEIVKIANLLKASGYKIGVISNSIEPHVECIKRKGWYKPFSELILSSEVGMKKPEVGIYKLALKKMKVKASESLFIDDREKNLITAEKLGMKTILFKNVKQLREDLLKLGIIF